MLRGSAYIFADECCKKKLLDCIFTLYQRMDWYLCTFCITDSCAYFITETDDKVLMYYGLQMVICDYLQWHRNHAVYIGYISLSQEEGTEERMETIIELALRSRQIHRIPLEQGYVSNICDYWWSSYITYMDIYTWEQMDCESLLRFFSSDPETARRRIRRFHQDGEYGAVIYNEEDEEI